ncbi:lysozyme inhibitor LprI family protein [Neobacillus muris]|uniref:lysozyme inhibitor LprI family protein n=1 Tax=Neobacillus muris TaxID=2941334 RepID=UPI00203BFB76|nr:lysozyme inhibitor LprI family protein [Neobacillus muris]
MKKSKSFIVATLLVILLVGMSACSNTSDHSTSLKNQSDDDSISESTDDSTSSNDSYTDSTVKSDKSDNNNSVEASINNENMQEDQTSKITGRRNEFIEKLDNIQKELDAMPEKKDSDSGVTNAMKNYYGVSYEKYDKALNEIYALLQKELSPEIMEDLKAEQIKWINQKEETANQERLKYNGGTFENVALYISLYTSTKERCYELVRTYMTDQ